MARRIGPAALACAALALGTTACFGTSSSGSSGGSSTAVAPAAVSTVDAAAQHEPVELEFWSNYSGAELPKYHQAFEGFTKQYPWITVKGTGGIDDAKIIAAINGGSPPDALLSFSPDNTGKFCSSGAWLNLNDYIKQDGLDLSIFPPAGLQYSGYQGIQCSLPALADSYGLYYNKKVLADAGYSDPPKTLTELAEMAKKLTVRKADGSLKQIGFNPIFGHYETFGDALRIAYGAPWFDADGKPILSKDPKWAAMLQWQKDLVDWYGYENLQKFTAASADEFSADNDFEIGRVAMQYDGEWRNAFLRDEHPDIDYGTAPFPAAADHPEQYGAGTIGGDIVAIPKGAKHPAEAWLLIRYLATDTDALVGLSNRLKNLPTTKDSLASPAIEPDPQFATFLQIFANEKSEFNPLTPIGQEYSDTFGAFANRWQAGKVKDLRKGLEGLDQQITDQLAQGAGSAP